MWRFTQAGGRYFPFDNTALDTLFEVSKGNPRTICGVTQVALEYAGATNQAITPAIITDVAKRRIVN
jgi:hypothetical protein